MIGTKPVLSLGLLLALIACRPEQKSDVKHDSGRFVNSESSFQWLTISEDSYRSSEENILPEDAPQTVQLQKWADALREEMIKSTPAVAKAPRPIIRLSENEAVDAHTSTTTVCIDVGMTTNLQSRASIDEENAYLQAGASITNGPKRADCEVYKGTMEESLSFVRWALRSVPSCEVSIKGSQIVLASGCSQSQQLSQENFAGMQVSVTHNYLTLTTGLVDKLPENQVVATLAHELAHYYMGHATAEKGLYNYFYVRSKDNDHQKPIRLSESDPLSILALNVQELVFGEGSEEELKPLIQSATDKGLGFYTVEQEADDIATEAVARLGLDSKAMIEMALSLGEQNGSDSAAECRKNYESGFLTAVWVGDLMDPHHDTCYRAYNSFLEIKNHSVH